MFPSLLPFEGCLLVISLLMGRFQASSTDGSGFVGFIEVDGVLGLECGGNGMFPNWALRYLMRWCKFGGGVFFRVAFE